MGRNSGGVALAYKSSSKEISIGYLGLTPKQMKVYGGKNELGGFISKYNDKVKNYLSEFTQQITKGTKKQIKILLDYYNNNQDKGTNKDFISYLKDQVKKVDKGAYNRGLLNVNGALVDDIIDGYAKSRARRLLIGSLNKQFKNN